MRALTIVGATLVAGPNAAPRPGTTLAIRDGRIADRPDPDATVVDVGGAVVTAGFWNCHVHLSEPTWTGARRQPAGHLQAGLDDLFGARGFTSVVDLASRSGETLALRRRIEHGELRGPRIRTAAEAIRPFRGIPFYVKGEVPWYLRWAVPTPATARGGRRVAERQIAKGAEVVKLFTGSYVTPTRVKPMRLGVARAAVTVAHARGALVFAHTSDRTGLAVALEAGVDVVAHVPDTTQGTGDLLRDAARAGVWLVPTLDMFAQTVTRDPAYLDPIDDALGVFTGAGGRLLFGTDVGYLRDHDTRGELAALARCGLGVDDVLAMLTTAPAEAFGTGSGTVAAGEPADLVVLDRLQEVCDLAEVRATIRGGRVIWGQPAPS